MSSPLVRICRVRQNFFETSNDRGFLLLPSNAYTPAAYRLYCFDNIIKGRVRQKLICLQTDQGKVVRFFYCDRQRTILNLRETMG